MSHPLIEELRAYQERFAREADAALAAAESKNEWGEPWSLPSGWYSRDANDRPSFLHLSLGPNASGELPPLHGISRRVQLCLNACQGISNSVLEELAKGIVP